MRIRLEDPFPSLSSLVEMESRTGEPLNAAFWASGASAPCLLESHNTGIWPLRVQASDCHSEC